MTSTKYDVTIFGATSFVGKLLCRYLVETFGQELNWAAAARSRDKLDALKVELGAAGKNLPTVQADVTDELSLRTLCEHTRVVISTVGPYALYGEPLVKICAETGTDYCDLTGEIQWVHKMLQRYEKAAKASGARIVHCCGFDSISSDMGVYHLQQQARERFGQPCNKVKMRLWDVKSGFGGSSAVSLLNVIKEAVSDPNVRKVMRDPYAICPPDYQPKLRQPDVKTAQRDPDFDVWVAPFIMAPVNTRVVQRSHALLGQAYGNDFTYEEAMVTGSGVSGAFKASLLTAALGALVSGAAFGPTRKLMARLYLAPGAGPSPQAQEAGFYDLRFLGTTTDGCSLRTQVYDNRDPGYGSTVEMLGQAGACLAFDTPKDSYAGGFWTPASLFGERLMARLSKGIRFTVLDE